MEIFVNTKNTLPCLLLALSSCISISAVAQDESKQASKVTTLQQVIGEQQKQPGTQQTQLDLQIQDLQMLYPPLPILTDDGKPLPVTTSNTPSRRNDLQTNRRDDAQAHDDWQGSFRVNDSDTRIKIGGFIELDVIHDTDAIQSKGQFIPASILTKNATRKDGTEGQTNFSISPSRLYIETRTPIDQKRVKTFISIDLYGDELGLDPELRVRQAYMELSNSLFGGDLLIGQAWSSITDLESTADVLDFRGTDNLFGSLVPQVRWSKQIRDGVKLIIAAEAPNNHIIEGADALTRLPDAVLAVTWDSNTFNLMASILVADLRASFNNGPVKSAVGYGGSLSGKVKLPFGSYQNNFLFSLTNGIGIGSHYQNAHADAVYDTSNNKLELIENFGVTLGYVHGWNARLKSTFTYCCVEIYNEKAQPAESLQSTEYTSGNLLWDINTHWMIGIEGLWGKRKDKDNTRGDNFRTLFTSRLSF